MSTNLASTIVPKSDQLNADDLISGPRTITITKITVLLSGEQPVIIHYEGDDGHPYKPGKSMRRVLAVMWGLDGSVFIGRRLTLYRDPEIKFGADVVGGIRISHASDLVEDFEMPLTVTRGRRKPYRVHRLIDESPCDMQALTDVGDTKAGEGTAALQAWWKTLPAAAKKALKGKLDTEWKQRAQDVDGSKAT